MPTTVTSSILKAASTPAIATNVSPEVLAHISQARTSHSRSKDGAAEAAAFAYLVWRLTQAPYAHASEREWLNKSIEERNNAINLHNQEVNKFKQRVVKYAKNMLPADDLAMQASTDPVKAAEIEAEKQKLVEHQKLSSSQWAALKKVRISQRNNNSEFNIIVKFTFGFEHSSEASLASRYTLVLEWIHQHFADIALTDIKPIVSAIKEAGGLEIVINQQRGHDPSKLQTAKDSEVIAKAIAKQSMDAIAKAQPKAQFSMEINQSSKGVVLLLARQNGSDVQVVGQIPIKANKVEAVVAQFEDDVILPTYETSEFLARVLSLGDLIPEGKPSEVVEGDEVIGHTSDEARSMILLPNQTSGCQLMISARNADASVVVKATPKQSKCDFGIIENPLGLGWSDRRRLQNLLSTATMRRLVEMSVRYDHAVRNPYSWIATTQVLVDAKSPNGVVDYVWRDITQEGNKPLDIDHSFKPRFSIDVTASDITDFVENTIKKWATKVDGKKSSKPMTLAFTSKGIIYKFGDDPEATLPSTGNISSVLSMKFRSRDLHDLIIALAKQKSDTFTFTGDGSLMCVAWSDQLGHYTVYLPTVTEKGALETKRLSPLWWSSEHETKKNVAA